MATRLYFSSTAYIKNSPTVDATWERSFSGFGRYYLTSSPNSSFNTFSENVTGTNDSCFAQFVSLPMASIHTWDFSTSQPSTTFVMRMAESSAAANQFYRVVFRILSNDGTTEHSDGGFTGGLELNTSLQSRRLSGVTNAYNTYTNSIGDRLVVELGVNTAVTGHTFSAEHGGNAGTDLTDGNTDTDQDNPWVEWSHNITFGSDDDTSTPQMMLTGVGR